LQYVVGNMKAVALKIARLTAAAAVALAVGFVVVVIGGGRHEPAAVVGCLAFIVLAFD